MTRLCKWWSLHWTLQYSKIYWMKIKTTKNKWDLIKLKSYCTAKEKKPWINKQTTLRMGGNICKWSNQQGINLQSIQVVHAAQYKKRTDNPSKLGRRSKLTLLQRRRTSGQKVHENINSTNYWRNANQNYNEVLSHTGQYNHHQKSTNSKCWREYEEKGTILHY